MQYRMHKHKLDKHKALPIVVPVARRKFKTWFLRWFQRPGRLLILVLLIHHPSSIINQSIIHHLTKPPHPLFPTHSLHKKRPSFWALRHQVNSFPNAYHRRNTRSRPGGHQVTFRGGPTAEAPPNRFQPVTDGWFRLVGCYLFKAMQKKMWIFPQVPDWYETLVR